MRKAVTGALMASVLLVMGVLQASTLASAREETLRTAEGRATNLALILSRYLTQTIAAGDAALRQLALHNQRIGGPTAADRAWLPILDSARAGLAGISSISVLDESLTIRHSTQSGIVGQSRQSEAYLKEGFGNDSDELLIGGVFQSPLFPQTRVVPLARRLTTADGRVEGAVVAAFFVGDLRPFFRSVDVGQRGALWVIHHSGVLMAREPSTENATEPSLDANPLFHAAVQSDEGGVLRAPFEPNGPEQISAFRRVDPLPLTVAISLDRDEVLAAWRREAAAAIASLAAVTGLLAVALVVAFRQMDAKAYAEQMLEQARREEAERLREAHHRLAETLVQEQAAREEAQAANALKDQFLMTVSHELRTPLTAIAGWARMLVDGQVRTEHFDQALRAIDRNAQVQTRLIEDLLDMAGIMRGKLRLEISETSVDDVVKHAVEVLSPAVMAKRLELDVQLTPPSGTIAADADRVEQIVWNLIANAVKFTPSGGRIAVSVARDDGFVRIQVSDSGKGIEPEFLPHVFDRFTQGHAAYSRRYAGLGLGLAIVHSLAAMHGGDVSAFSEGEGKGSTFVVRLPASGPAAGREASVDAGRYLS